VKTLNDEVFLVRFKNRSKLHHFLCNLSQIKSLFASNPLFIVIKLKFLQRAIWVKGLSQLVKIVPLQTMR